MHLTAFECIFFVIKFFCHETPWTAIFVKSPGLELILDKEALFYSKSFHELIHIYTGFKQETQQKTTLTDYGCPMKPFFIEIQNFWAWADKLII